MTVPVSGVGQIQPVTRPLLQGRVTPVAPVRFLESRDLFFSAASVRANIEPFLNQPDKQRLYLNFSLPPETSTPRKLLNAPQAVLILERTSDAAQKSQGITSYIGYYDANDTVAANPWQPWPRAVMQYARNVTRVIDETRFSLEGLTPQTPGVLARLMTPVIRWLSTISPLAGARLAQALPAKLINKNGEDFMLQNNLRLPGGLQAARVLYDEPMQTYPESTASKALRQSIGQDVLSAVSRLEGQGYVLQGQTLEAAALISPDTAATRNASATAAAAATKPHNPFKLKPDILKPDAEPIPAAVTTA